MLLPQQKTFYFSSKDDVADQDKQINKWIKERMQEKEHVSPSAPSVIELANGDIRVTYLYAKEVK